MEQNEAGQRLTGFCQENTLVIANTLFQQHKRRHYTWTSPDGQYRNLIDYILCSQRWRSSIQSAKTSLGADCGSDLELLIVKFRLKLKKVGKTTRPFKVKVKSLSRVRPLVTPWTAAYQAPPSMRFSRQEYWSGAPLPSPEIIQVWPKSNPLQLYSGSDK